MSLFFCESWPGKDYVDFLNLVAESKSIIKGIEMGLKRSKLSLRNYGRDALNVPTSVYGPKEFILRHRKYYFHNGFISRRLSADSFVGSLQNYSDRRAEWFIDESDFKWCFVDDVKVALFNENLMDVFFIGSLGEPLGESAVDVLFPSDAHKERARKDIVHSSDLIERLISGLDEIKGVREVCAYCARGSGFFGALPYLGFLDVFDVDRYNKNLLRFCRKINHPFFDENFFCAYLPNRADSIRRVFCDPRSGLVEEFFEYERAALDRFSWLIV